MTQIEYPRPFRDGKWSEGYIEIKDPRPSGYYLPFTIENYTKVERYLKRFEFERAEDLYRRLSNRYPYRKYSELKKKYVRAAFIKKVIGSKNNRKMRKYNKTIGNIVILKCNNCNNFRIITPAYLKEKNIKIYNQIRHGDFSESFRCLLEKKEKLFRCSNCGQKDYSVLIDSGINEQRNSFRTDLSIEEKENKHIKEELSKRQESKTRNINSEIRILKKPLSWNSNDINYQPWNYGSPKGNHWR